MAVTAKKLLTPDEVQELNDQLRYFQGDESEQGRREYARIRSKLKSLKHDETCTVCPQQVNPIYEVDMPFDTTGKPFSINGKEYVGHCFIPACEWATLSHMISENRAEQMRHTQEKNSTTFMGQIGNLARAVQG